MDKTGSYHAVFYVAGASLLPGAALVCLTFCLMTGNKTQSVTSDTERVSINC